MLFVQQTQKSVVYLNSKNKYWLPTECFYSLANFENYTATTKGMKDISFHSKEQQKNTQISLFNILFN